jgi:hypothetical protein
VAAHRVGQRTVGARLAGEGVHEVLRHDDARECPGAHGAVLERGADGGPLDELLVHVAGQTLRGLRHTEGGRSDIADELDALGVGLPRVGAGLADPLEAGRGVAAGLGRTGRHRVNLAGQAVGRLVRADLPLVLVDLAADLLDLGVDGADALLRGEDRRGLVLGGGAVLVEARLAHLVAGGLLLVALGQLGGDVGTELLDELLEIHHGSFLLGLDEGWLLDGWWDPVRSTQ